MPLPAELDAGPSRSFHDQAHAPYLHDDPEGTLEGWRAAAERAAAAEKLLKDAFDSYLNGTAGAPTPVHIAEAKLLRALANNKLQAAMSGIDDKRDKK